MSKREVHFNFCCYFSLLPRNRTANGYAWLFSAIDLLIVSRPQCALSLKCEYMSEISSKIFYSFNTKEYSFIVEETVLFFMP